MLSSLAQQGVSKHEGALTEVSRINAPTGASKLGFALVDLLDLVKALTPANFYKRMTAHANYAVQQDVYLPGTNGSRSTRNSD